MLDPGRLRHRMTVYYSGGTKYGDRWFAVDRHTKAEEPTGSAMVDIGNNIVIDPAETCSRNSLMVTLTGRYDDDLINTMYAVWGTKTLQFIEVDLDEISREQVTIQARQVS